MSLAVSNSSRSSMRRLNKRNVIAVFCLILILLTVVFVIFISDSRIAFNHYMRNMKFHAWTTSADCESSSDWDTVLNSKTLTGEQIMNYFSWTGNRQSCRLVQDFGGTMYKNPSGWDGQKSVCIDPQVAPQPGECLVYSFGINNEWSFDEQMSAYGCQVYAFDPSMSGKDQYEHNPGNVHFYKWGLGDRDKHDVDNNWTIRSLSSIHETLSALHGRKIIDYLKMDIEASEWQVLPEIIHSGMMSNVRQLGIEIHLVTDAPLEKYRDYAKLLKSMETMGMVRFDSEYNPWFMGNFTQLEIGRRSQGYEIAWYNRNLTRISTVGVF
jgi:hypothetical protein